MRSLCIRRLLPLVSAVLLLAAGPARAALLGPSPYLGFADSPFFGLGITLEDFEDGALDVAGVTASGGVALPPDVLTDSVDSGGFSYYSGDPGVTKMTFTFSGPLPTRAGVVWTDVGRLLGETSPFTAQGDVVFEAFDEDGASLGQIGPVLLGDGQVFGSQAEDRFFGVVHLGGISRIEIGMPDSDDWEIDHLQFGVPVPEPGTASLLLAGLSVLAARARRRAAGASPPRPA